MTNINFQPIRWATIASFHATADKVVDQSATDHTPVVLSFDWLASAGAARFSATRLAGLPYSS